MRKIISVLLFVAMFSMTSYAGEWKQDAIGWWYQADDGTYKTGWYQDVDGKWYYFDIQSGYMLANTVTPDGYTVSSDGSWVEGEVKETKSFEGYDNKAELQATAYNLPIGDTSLGYILPVNVYYNMEFDNAYEGKINVHKVELSKNGVPYIKLNVEANNRTYGFTINYKYHLSDGTVVDKHENVWGSCESGGTDVSYSLLSGGVEKNAASLEIFIDKVIE